MEDTQKLTQQEISQWLTIDHHKIPEELLVFPKTLNKLMTSYSGIIEKRDEAKFDIEKVSSMLDHDIRSNPAGYNIAKLTEKTVSSTLSMQPSYIEVNERYMQYKKEAEIINNAITSYREKLTCMKLFIECSKLEFYDPSYISLGLTASTKKSVENEINKKIKDNI